MEVNKNPEKALIASYVIKLLNRDASSKVDRLLKSDYEEVKKHPLILDTILRAQLLSFFSDTGCSEITRKLMEYYREYELYSALLDAKNMLVICSKEDITNSSVPFTPKMLNIVKILISKEKGHIVRKHIKSAIAACVLIGRLGDDFKNLMENKLEVEGLDSELTNYLRSTCEECQKELKDRIEESKPLEERKDEHGN
jgi:hypothetical protein